MVLKAGKSQLSFNTDQGELSYKKSKRVYQ